MNANFWINLLTSLAFRRSLLKLEPQTFRLGILIFSRVVRYLKLMSSCLNASPRFLGIEGSLRDFPEGSKVMEYNKVLQGGITEGIDSCQSRYSACDEESYELMKTSQTEDAATSA
ncbi:UNVERIFIED_CONTAM: hypothetical protein NCL1_36972 [Trichonephila clavipes]